MENIGFEHHKIDISNRCAHIKSVQGGIYTLDRYNLLTRVDMNELTMNQTGDRVIVKDKDDLIIMDVDVNDIGDWQIKQWSDDVEEHFFTIRSKGVFCQMLVEGYVEVA